MGQRIIRLNKRTLLTKSTTYIFPTIAGAGLIIHFRQTE
jgi:hypothetical protein